MRSYGLSRESSPYLEWDCEGTGSKLQRVPRALRFGLQLVVDQMLQTLKSCSVCRAPYYGGCGRGYDGDSCRGYAMVVVIMVIMAVLLLVAI